MGNLHMEGESMVGVAKSGNQQHSGKEGMLPLIASSSSLSPSFLLRWGSNNADAVTNGGWRGGGVARWSGPKKVLFWRSRHMGGNNAWKYGFK